MVRSRPTEDVDPLAGTGHDPTPSPKFTADRQLILSGCSAGVRPFASRRGASTVCACRDPLAFGSRATRRTKEGDLSTFVLVHGAMHGGWCWRDVQRLLVANGHDVYRPTLTGQGDRRGALSPDVGMSTHVRDVEELLWFEDLTEVHLVLHSYTGVLAGPLAEHAQERLASVVYLGAFLAGPGQSLLDVEPPEVAERYRRQALRTAKAGTCPRRTPSWSSGACGIPSCAPTSVPG